MAWLVRALIILMICNQ